MTVVRSPVAIVAGLIGALAVAIPVGLVLHSHATHSSQQTVATRPGQSLEGFTVYRLIRDGQDKPGKPRGDELVVPGAGNTVVFDVLARRPLATLRAQYAWVLGSHQLFIVQMYAPPAQSLIALAGHGKLAGIVGGVAVRVGPVEAQPAGGGPNFGVGFRTQSDAVAFASSLTTQVTNYSQATTG